MKTTFIYALCDPDTEMVRYVGKADCPKTRYYHHLKDKHKTYKVNWIKKLQSEGKTPLLKILQEVEISLWEESEKKWVDHYRLLVGKKLTNITEGGIGPPMTEKTRAKISKSSRGRIMPEKVRKKISDSTKGRITGLKTRIKIKKAFTPEIRQRISEALKGKKRKKQSPETIKKRLLARKDKIPFFSPETLIKLSELGKARTHSPETKLKLSEQTKRYFSDPSARLKQSENTKKYFQLNPEDPESRKKLMDVRKGRVLTDQHRNNISKALSAYSSDPEIKKQKSESAEFRMKMLMARNKNLQKD